MIVIVGPSASGKTELATALINEYNYQKVITTTTRKPRIGEVNHIDYHFLTHDEFTTQIANNYFAEHTLYNDNYYGTAKQDLQQNKIIILDPTGLNNLLSFKFNLFVVYLFANTKIRKSRMIMRGDSNQEIEKRLLNDSSWFHKNSVKQINLFLKNNRDFCHINKLAKLVNNKYQKFLKTDFK